MAEKNKFPCQSGECPDIDPATGRFSGTSTVRATVGEVQQFVTVAENDLLSAARAVRTEAMRSVWKRGNRAQDQTRIVPATTLQGEPILNGVRVNGAVLTAEARQVRRAQIKDIFHGVR